MFATISLYTFLKSLDNFASGETIWHLNLTKDFGGRTPGWGYSESPLIVGELVIVTPGGSQGTIVALDKITGKKIWQSDSVTEGAHYSTPVIATINGVKQIVQFGNRSVFGVSLNDGKQLWSYAAAANGTANCCSPIVEDDFVFASSAYGTGGGLVKVGRSAARLGQELHRRPDEDPTMNRASHRGTTLVGLMKQPPWLR